MNEYTNEERDQDFDYFVDNYQNIYKQYGHSFIAIKNKHILGSFNSIMDAVNKLSNKYQVGTYIIQECTGKESAYRVDIMRLKIKGYEN